MILEGKNAIVTGCARGIGKAIVECFAENGANVWACARKETTEFEEFCRETSYKHNVNIEPLYFDMTDDLRMKDAVKKIHSEKRTVDILVNNAGISPEKNTIFQMTKFEDIDYVMNVNFTAAMKLTQYMLKFMIRQKPRGGHHQFFLRGSAVWGTCAVGVCRKQRRNNRCDIKACIRVWENGYSCQRDCARPYTDSHA